MTMESNPVFETVEQLFENRPFSVEYAELLFRMTLEQNAEATNDYFAVYEGETDQTDTAITGVQLRIPTEQGDDQGGLIVLDVDPEQCIDKHEVVDV